MSQVCLKTHFQHYLHTHTSTIYQTGCQKSDHLLLKGPLAGEIRPDNSDQFFQVSTDQPPAKNALNPPSSVDENCNTVNTPNVVSDFSLLQNKILCSAHLFFG